MNTVRRIAKRVWAFDPLEPVFEAVARNPERFLLWFMPIAIITVGLLERPH